MSVIGKKNFETVVMSDGGVYRTAPATPGLLIMSAIKVV